MSINKQLMRDLLRAIRQKVADGELESSAAVDRYASKLRKWSARRHCKRTMAIAAKNRLPLSPAMELRLDTRALQDAVARAKQLLKDRRLVVVFGDRLTLMSFCVAEPIRPSLVGAATTEDEGFELVRRTQPDLLICSSDLETGYGP